MTAAERRLWSRLRNGRFHGLKWRRQEPIGSYIVDFYCPAPRIAVELDGMAHSYTVRQDNLRQTWLEEQGILVLRFPNDAVLHGIDEVLGQILTVCESSIPTTESTETE